MIRESTNCINNQFQNMHDTLIEKVNIRRHLINTLFSLVSINLFLAGLSFITTLLIANLLGKERFGDLSYSIAVGGYCLTIAFCGLERTLIRDLMHFPKSFDEYTSASILLRGSMLLLGLIFILGVNFFSAEENRLGIAGILIVLSVGITALSLAPIYDAWDKMKRHTIYLLMERCFYFVCIWALAFFLKDSLSILAIALFMLVSASLGLLLQYRWAFQRLDVRIDRNIFYLSKNMLRENLWVWSALIAQLSFGGLSRIVLKHIAGSGELGEFAVAWQVVILGSIFILQVGRIGNPHIAMIVQPNIKHVNRKRFLLKYTALSTCAGGIIGVMAICFPGNILRILRPEFASAATTLRILGIYVIVIGIGQVATQYLIAIRREKMYSVVIILTGSLSLFLYYFCIPRWSATGAAISVLIAHGIAISIFLVAMYHHMLCNCMYKNNS